MQQAKLLQPGMSKIANGGRQALILPTWAALCFPDSDPNNSNSKMFRDEAGMQCLMFPRAPIKQQS